METVGAELLGLGPFASGPLLLGPFAPGPLFEPGPLLPLSSPGPCRDTPGSPGAVVGAGAAVVGGVVDTLFCDPVGFPLSVTPCEAPVLGDTPTLSPVPPVGACESGTAPLPCILQVSVGAVKYESSVTDSPPGTIRKTLVVVGQFGVGKSPESVHTATAVW